MKFIYNLTLISAVVQAAALSSNPGATSAQLATKSLPDLAERIPGSGCSAVPAVPTPPGARCGVTGQLQHRNVLFRSDLSHSSHPLRECRKLCLEHSGCLSFAFKASESRCRAFGSTLAAQGFQGSLPPNGNVFYSRNCFKTECSKPPTSSCVSARLSSPTAITGYSGGTADQNLNLGQEFSIPLPFQIGYGVYGSYQAQMSVDGFLYADDGSKFSFLEWAPFSQSMRIDYGENEGLFYEIDGSAPNRVAKFEWRTTDSSSAQRYSIVLQLYEADPYSATYSYQQVSDDGAKALSAVYEGPNSGEYSWLQARKLVTGLTLDVQTDDQTFKVNPLPLCN